MASNLKALGLILVAVLATSAMVASSASAEGKLKSDGPVTLDIATTGGTGTATTMFGERIDCPGTVYTGHKVEVTPHVMIPNASTTVTLTTDYTQPCTTSGGGEVTVVTNGCDYLVHIGKTAAAPNTYAVTTDLVCPAGKHLQMEVFSGAKHEAATRTCTRTFKPQNGVAGAHLTNTTKSNTIYLGGTFKNIHVEQSGTCGTATTLAAESHFDITLEGRNAEGAGTALLVSDSESGQGLLTSDGPVTLLGAGTNPTASNALTAFSARTECPGSTYTGHSVGSTTEPIASGSTTATITPQYKQPCPVSENRQATVEMNGCDYVFHIGEEASASTFGVTTDIVCPKEKAIHVSMWSVGREHKAENRYCTLIIPPQSGRSGAHITSTPSSDDLDLTGTFKSIIIGREGTCLGDGKGSVTLKGEIHLNATVTGTNAEGGTTGVTVS